ncbi:MAG: phosphomannomutase/phosphoglucomutase [Pyrinomonadaceae bacterium]
MNTNIFREYDIRGIVGEDLNASTVEAVSRGIAVFLKRNGVGVVALGFDARESSPEFADILAKQMNSAGIDVVSIGMVPTPVLYHTVYTRPVDGGVMITGSHNPSNYNGFKICLGKQTLFGDQIREIRDLVLSGESEAGAGETTRLDVLNEYIHDILSGIKVGDRRIRAVVDSGNGMGAVTAIPVFNALGAEIVELFSEPDSRFPNHHPDPTVEENLQSLVSKVVETGADIGIAFDGDADRIGVVDETGRIIWGDELMVLLSRAVLSENPGATIIAEVKCSENLFEDIRAKGGTALMFKAGHSIIKAKMKETGALLAGEMSGHIFFADKFYGFDDACYAGARILEILSKTDRQLSEYFSDLPKKFSTPELRMDCPEEEKFEVVERIANEYSPTHAVDTTDGARITFEHGWGLVRASNTQAILVLRFEADNEESLAEIRNEIEGKLGEMRKSAAEI